MSTSPLVRPSHGLQVIAKRDLRGEMKEIKGLEGIDERDDGGED